MKPDVLPKGLKNTINFHIEGNDEGGYCAWVSERSPKNESGWGQTVNEAVSNLCRLLSGEFAEPFDGNHKGDPCQWCGVPHDEVEVGPCKGARINEQFLEAEEMTDQEKLYNKYKIEKANGEPTDPNAEYFVLRMDTDPAARKAMLTYADETEKSGNIIFANQIRDWVRPMDDSLSLSPQPLPQENPI